MRRREREGQEGEDDEDTPDALGQRSVYDLPLSFEINPMCPFLFISLITWEHLRMLHTVPVSVGLVL